MRERDFFEKSTEGRRKEEEVGNYEIVEACVIIWGHRAGYIVGPFRLPN